MPLIREFESAIRGFHYYKRYWNPRLEEELFCSHEEENAFDVFAIKITDESGVIRGHLPREISRVTKFLLDRGAKMTTVLTSEHYRRLPLVQGGLEIPYRVKIIMVNTKKCSQVLDRYLDLIDTLYTEPNPPVILGSILSDNLIMESEPKEKRKCPKSVTSTNKMKKTEPKSMDIRKMFLDQGCKTPSQKKKKQEENNVIILD